MKRIGFVGTLVFVLALSWGPALAQDPEDGSALPGPSQQQVLPEIDHDDEASLVSAPPASQPALADTGLQISSGALLAWGLFAVGGGALVAAHRRAGGRQNR